MRSNRSDPAVLVGLDDPDDAAVYRITEEIALVQTVDFFTPIVDDPYDWGYIAAVNALSDVYAMGATPKTALNLLGWPRSLGFELLGDVLTGVSDVCERAGVAIVGGHSVDDPEPKFGLAVSGFVDPGSIVRKRGGEPGDVLVLTKALGTGVISSAIKDGLAPEETISSAVASMKTLNDAASRAMVKAGVTSATDVTGFGLIGHLLEMLGDTLDAELVAGEIPLLRGAADLAREGILPGGSKRNLEAGLPSVELDPGIDEGIRALLFDAQTSGGLLMAVPRDGLDELLSSLRSEEVEISVVIGGLERGTGRVRVKP